jgi:hypothetical protein
MHDENDGFYFGLLDLLIPWLQPVLITLKYRQYSTITNVHIFQFTIAHTLGFPAFTIHVLATDLNTETVEVSLEYIPPISLHYSTHKAFKSHIKSSQAGLLHSSVLLVPICSSSLQLN